jgi:hypothetical protein
MECSLCNESCGLPSDAKSTSKFAVILKDGKIVCNHCRDVIDWADTCFLSNDNPLSKPKDESKIESTQPVTKKIQSITIIRCIKCKAQFSDKFCACGFKNPLFR